MYELYAEIMAGIQDSRSITLHRSRVCSATRQAVEADQPNRQMHKVYVQYSVVNTKLHYIGPMPIVCIVRLSLTKTSKQNGNMFMMMSLIGIGFIGKMYSKLCCSHFAAMFHKHSIRVFRVGPYK